jgi:hypothetical protein
MSNEGKWSKMVDKLHQLYTNVQAAVTKTTSLFVNTCGDSATTRFKSCSSAKCNTSLGWSHSPPKGRKVDEDICLRMCFAGTRDTAKQKWWISMGYRISERPKQSSEAAAESTIQADKASTSTEPHSRWHIVNYGWSFSQISSQQASPLCKNSVKELEF